LLVLVVGEEYLILVQLAGFMLGTAAETVVMFPHILQPLMLPAVAALADIQEMVVTLAT
jgi:hypothetical protein